MPITQKQSSRTNWMSAIKKCLQEPDSHNFQVFLCNRLKKLFGIFSNQDYLATHFVGAKNFQLFGVQLRLQAKCKKWICLFTKSMIIMDLYEGSHPPAWAVNGEQKRSLLSFRSRTKQTIWIFAEQMSDGRSWDSIINLLSVARRSLSPRNIEDFF